MKSNQHPIFILILILISSCQLDKIRQPNKTKRLIVEDVIAEGDISSDLVYNGHIKFYDTTTNKLVIESDYKNGKLDGKSTDYYLNGKRKCIGYYTTGKENGKFSYFDSTGQLTAIQEFYYGLKVGGDIEYRDGKPSKYYFTSFDNENLFYIDYDSVYNKEIKKLNDDNFFFFHANDVHTITTTDKLLNRQKYFIYLINPPDFNFEYSLCIIDKSDSILRIEKTFSKTKPWDTFILEPTKLKAGERFTLRLYFQRDLNDSLGEKGDMLKRL